MVERADRGEGGIALEAVAAPPRCVPRAEWVDALFESHCQRRYTRELLFSTMIDLMSLVVLGLQPSPVPCQEK